MKRILVVDDNKLLANSLAILLRHEGYEVDTAYNGAEAKLLLRDQQPPYDVMILDMKLPVVDGVGVLEQAALMPIEVPTVILTGDEKSVPNPLPHNVRHTFIKAADAPEILAKVREMLDDQRSTQL